jgi:diguanylate cyclase (GGDEF)-like protein
MNTPSTPSHPARPLAGARWLSLLLLGAVMLLAGAGFALINSERRQAWHGAEQDLLNLAIGAQTELSTVLRQAEFSLRGACQGLKGGPARPARLLQALGEAARYDPVSSLLGVMWAGRWLAVSADGQGLDDGPSSRLQPLLQAALAQADGDGPADPAAARLAPLVRHPDTGQWLLPLVTRCTDADGQPFHMASLLTSATLTRHAVVMRLVPGSFVTLATASGRRLFRYFPEIGEFVANGPALRPESMQLMREAGQGNFVSFSAQDGAETLHGFSMAGELPFLAGASVRVSRIEDGWKRAAAAPLGLMGLGLLGIVAFWVLLRRSVRQQLEEAYARACAARRDALTGALNRDAFVRELAADTGAEPYAVALLSLRRFREINDGLGHAVGDAVLCAVVQRLQALVGPQVALVCRLGGDEFALRLAPAEGGLTPLLEALAQAVAAPMSIGSERLEVTAAIGVAHHPADATTPSDLLRCADMAMHHAKAGMRPFEVYTPSQDRASPPLLALRAEFAQAVREGALELAFQPKIRLCDGSVSGAEALARWNHPTRGAVSPGVFVPLAESTELIHPFTSLVLRRALQAQASWAAAGCRIPVAVNVSANNLLNPDFVPELERVLHEFGVAEGQLELEITESAVMRDPALVIPRLHAIRALGVTLSIDDFGTGFTSLAYLKRLPVQALKVDRAFVTHMKQDRADRRIVRTTIGLAHGFGLKVVAEGVETDDVRALLLAMHCDQAQGYFFSRPVGAHELLAIAQTPPAAAANAQPAMAS